MLTRIFIKRAEIFWGGKNIYYIPVIDRDRNVIDLFSKRRAYYSQYLKASKLPRMHYAECIYNAAIEAVKLGYRSMSVIEFGVAGGNGLRNCEFHAREIEHLLGIDIEVYGFDNNSGLPQNDFPEKEHSYMYAEGAYDSMERQKLEDKLYRAKLVIGDTRQTTKAFIDEYHPAPIGVMLIDVDYYISTVPILQMLHMAEENFIPRVWMYFDDINVMVDECVTSPYQGEALAVHEFNENSRDVKIAPEFESGFIHRQLGDRANIKVAFRTKHPLYSKYIHSAGAYDSLYYNHITY